MKKYFYSHIVEIKSVEEALAALELDAQERDELIVIVESSIHHIVIDLVLTELPHEDKRLFLKHLNDDEHENIWRFLSMRIERLEDRIKEAVNSYKKELHEDIKEAHKKKVKK
jgi:hypothetical protein